MLLGAVPECVVASSWMSTGMVLGVRTVDSLPQTVLDLVAAGSADLFKGDNVMAIEKMFCKSGELLRTVPLLSRNHCLQ